MAKKVIDTVGTTDTIKQGFTKVNDNFTELYNEILPAGTNSQYLRGDKTWQELNSASIGLGNVQNIDSTNPANINWNASYRTLTDAEKAKLATITTNGAGNNYLADDGIYKPVAAGGGTWGSITGTLSNQTDLNNALNAKSDTTHNHTGVYEPVSATITKQGNTFNGANQLVKLDATGKLPAVDGSALQNLPSGFTDPMTSIGDIIYRNGSNVTSRLARGTNGQVIKSDGTNIGYSTLKTSEITNDSNFVVDAAYVHTDNNFTTALKTNYDAAYTHTSNTSNPHSVTKTQVGLSNVTNDAQLKIASNLTDVADRQTAINNLTNTAGGANESILTKDTATGNAVWKAAGAVSLDHSVASNRDIAGNHAKLIPAVDSTTALQVTKADGTTPVIVTDTVNNDTKFYINGTEAVRYRGDNNIDYMRNITRYYSDVKTGDTIGDLRESYDSTLGIFKQEKCIGAGASKGAGTWFNFTEWGAGYIKQSGLLQYRQTNITRQKCYRFAQFPYASTNASSSEAMEITIQNAANYGVPATMRVSLSFDNNVVNVGVNYYDGTVNNYAPYIKAFNDAGTVSVYAFFPNYNDHCVFNMTYRSFNPEWTEVGSDSFTPTGTLIWDGSDQDQRKLPIYGKLGVTYNISDLGANAISADNTSTISTNGSYYNKTLYSNSNKVVNTGITDGGYLQGINVVTFRPNNVNDQGSLASMFAANLQYGHYGAASGVRSTTNSYGLYIQPYNQSGTISSMYDMYIASLSGTGTVTNHWGIYQQDAAIKNFLSSDTGIGIASPNTRLHIHRPATTATNLQVTNTSTGTNATDGLLFGIDGSGNAQVKQQENLPLYVYTNNILRTTWSAIGTLDHVVNIADTSDNSAQVTSIHSTSASGTYYSKGFVSDQSKTVATGQTDAGYLIGISDIAFRPNDVNDLGTLNSIYGYYSQYGHYGAGINRTTNNVYGLGLAPYAQSGTIDNLYGVHIAAKSGSGTVTNYWGIYQADTAAKNYFAGEARFASSIQLNPNRYIYFPATANQDTIGDKRLVGNTGRWERCTLGNATLGGGTWITDAAPAALTNNLGAWNANTNTPNIASGVGTAGDWYTVSVAGSTTIDGISSWGIGDYIWFDESTSTWQRVNNQVGVTTTPSGPTFAIQNNNGGAFGGFANFLYDNVNNQMLLKTTAGQESPSLGSELIVLANWVLGSGWSGTSPYTHTAGSTATLYNTLAASLNSVYSITITITGRTAGSVTVGIGGITSAAIISTTTVVQKAITTGQVIVTPTSDFNGSVAVSVKQSTASYGSVLRIADNTGVASFEIRNSLASNKNTYIGVNCAPLATTASKNVCIGVDCAASLTTGTQNVYVGLSAGQLNNGTNNVLLGYYAGSSSTASNTIGIGYASLSGATGGNNIAVGVNAGRSITTGTNNIFIGAECGYTSQATGISHSMAFGYGAYTTTSNTCLLGAASGTGYQVNVGIGLVAPTNKLHIDGGTATDSYAQWTAGTTTGQSANDGFQIGIDSTGRAIINQREAQTLSLLMQNVPAMVIGTTANVAIGNLNPTAALHLKAGTASASTAPLKFTTGTALTNPEDGAMEYHNSHLYFTIGTTRYQLDQQSAGGSLTNWSESNYLYNTKYGVKLTPNSAQTNVDVILQPKGSASIIAQQPNGLASGGNNRGVLAVDLQMQRTTADQVALGDYSVIIGGVDNKITASGSSSVVLAGYNNTCSSVYSAVIAGRDNSVSGYYSAILVGKNCATLGYYSTCIGAVQATANDCNEVVFGQYNTIATGNTSAWIATDRLVTVGIGTGSGSRADAIRVYKNGIIDTPAQSGCIVYLSANQTPATTDGLNDSSIVKYDTKVNDPLSEFNTTTGKFTPLKAGKYLVSVHFTYASVALTAGQAYGFYIIKGTSSISRNLRYVEANSTIARCVSESMIVDLAAGETLAIGCYAPVAVTCNGGRDWNTLAIQKLA